MGNWWEGAVQNTSPLAFQPNNQFALPTYGGDANQQMPLTNNLLAVAPTPLAPGAGGGAPDPGGLWGGGNLWGALGSTNKDGIRSDGWGGMALGAAQGLAGAFVGAKQYQLAQDGLKENKRQFSLNFDNQRKTVNAELEDRQRARVASSPSAYQSVGDYMQKHGV